MLLLTKWSFAACDLNDPTRVCQGLRRPRAKTRARPDHVRSRPYLLIASLRIDDFIFYYSPFFIHIPLYHKFLQKIIFIVREVGRDSVYKKYSCKSVIDNSIKLLLIHLISTYIYDFIVSPYFLFYIFKHKKIK